MSNLGSIHIDINEGLNRLKNFKTKLKENEFKKGLSKAINDALKEGRKKAIDVVSSSHKIPKTYLNTKGIIEILPSNTSRMKGEITADPKPLPLSMFKPQYYPSFGEGVSFRVLRSSKGKIGYAFMITGKPHVYARGYYTSSRPYGFVRTPGKNKGKDNDKVKRKRPNRKSKYKYPLTRLITVSVNGAMNGSRNKRIIENFIEKTLNKNMREELQRRVAKLK